MLADLGANNRAALQCWLGMDDAACAQAEAGGALAAAECEPPSLGEAPRRAFPER
jgi:hypothetical protein